MRNMEFEYFSLFLETFILFLDPFRDVTFLIVCISFFALEPNTPSICTNICHLSDPNPILKESVQMSHKGACTYYVITQYKITCISLRLYKFVSYNISYNLQEG